MEKLTIEKAREAIKDRIELAKFPDGRNLLYSAIGFIEGWESRQAEVDELNGKLKELHKILDKYQGESK